MQNIKKLAKIKTNKKALSQIVGMMLITLLAIASIGILWYFASQFIKQPLLSPQINCLDLQNSKEIEITKSCLNKESNELEITIKRSVLAKDEIKELKFILSDNKVTESWICQSHNYNQCNDCIILNNGEIKTYFLSPERTTDPKEIKIAVDNCELGRDIIVDC